MPAYSPEDFEDKVDSLYQLVIVAARRANQISRPDARPLVPVRSKKSTMVALEEIIEGKVKCGTESDEQEGLFE